MLVVLKLHEADSASAVLAVADLAATANSPAAALLSRDLLLSSKVTVCDVMYSNV